MLKATGRRCRSFWSLSLPLNPRGKPPRTFDLRIGSVGIDAIYVVICGLIGSLHYAFHQNVALILERQTEF